MARPLQVAICVPRRPDGGRRDELWSFCSTWWSDRFAWPIHEGEHLDGPFNRSTAINTAAQAAGDWDVALIIDSDVVAEPDQITAAIDAAHTTGRLTLAFDRYVNLDHRMTDRVLAGHSGTWEPGARYKMTDHLSSILAVPRRLWDTVGGFDERFVGWGHDDVAFAQACRVLGGGIDRTPGTVWHLWHPDSPERDTKAPLYKASKLLADRYWATLDPAAMAELVTRRPDGITLVVVTHGRRGCIAETIPSAEANLKGDIATRIISDDSGDIDYQAWLRHTFPGFEIITGKPGGFAANVTRGRNAAIAIGHPFVFWLEDDFTFNQPIDLQHAQAILRANPQLTQLALKRQPWFPAELKVGGFMEQHPAAFTDRDGWCDHTRFFTTNPHLTTRQFLTEHDWPNVPHSEDRFSRRVLTDGRTAGYLGKAADPPIVRHFGERTGKGY